MKVGEKIKRFRELRNFTQQHVAEQLEMSVSGYSKLERDETEISLAKLEKIAIILGVDIQAILNFNEKYIFNFQQSQSPNVALQVQQQNINQTELFDKIIMQYQNEIATLKNIINDLIKKN